MHSASPSSALGTTPRSACGPLLATALLLFAFSSSLAAQCHLPRDYGNSARVHSSLPSGESLLPESGLLTDTHYTSLYFGFSLQLPIPLNGHRIMLPIRLAGEHALLGIGFQDGQRFGTFVITAGGRRDEANPNMTPEQEQQRLDDIARGKPGPTPMERLDYTPPPVKLKRSDKHAGDVFGTQFSARIKEYMVRFTIQTNDKSFLEKSPKAIEAAHFYCADAAGNLFTPDGKPLTTQGTYTLGPTIPTAVVEQALSSRPAQQTIPASGYFAAGQYVIPQLEFSYTLPKGWTMTGAPQTQPAGDPPDPAVAQRLDYFWQSCARTLFRAAAPGSALTLELRVLDQTCMGLPAPASATDAFGSESLGEYLQMLGRFGKIKSNHLMDSGGHLFAVYSGTVATGSAAEHELERRAAQVIIATRYRKLIFAWCWSALTEAELKTIPISTLNLAGSPAIPLSPSMASQK